MHHCATADQAHWPRCWCWIWSSQTMCCPECRVCHKKPPFFTSQTVSVLNDAMNLWFPATIIHKGNSHSYMVQVIGGGQYRHAHDHIWEHHLDAVKADTSNIGDVAPAASASASATQTGDHQQLLHLQHQHQLQQQLHCKLHTKLCLKYVHHNKYRYHPLEPLWARPAQPLLSYTD